MRVDLSQNMITLPCYVLPKNTSIIFIDLSKNMISVLPNLCFTDMKTIKSLQLILNLLHTVHKKVFVNLTNLKTLNLSHNSLNFIPKLTLWDLPNLQTLSLVRNPLTFLDTNMFTALAVHLIECDDYRLCCLATSEISCTAKRQWYMSCINLIPTFPIAISFITVSCFGFNIE